MPLERECFKTWETFRGTLLKFYAQKRTRLEQWIDNRNYIGWLATPVDEPETIVAGAGVQLQPILPRPLGVSTIGEGRQGTILNVFTEPQWRQRGIAGLLIKEIVIWSKNEQIDRLTLHASNEGRSIYEKLGFVTSNKMRSWAIGNGPDRQARLAALMIASDGEEKLTTWRKRPAKDAAMAFSNGNH
jgi:GNAT superfamily N-acetyltransferase